jgi:AcrR family transcriptional regulator
VVADEPKPSRTGSRPARPGAPLPRGRPYLSPEAVREHQRDRIVAAVAQVMAERGYAALTVGSIIEVARISRTTFYNHFPNKREAVLGAHRLIAERFVSQLAGACEGLESWPEKVMAGIDATFEFVARDPRQALLIAPPFIAADPAVEHRIGETRERLAALLAEGRRHMPEGESLPAVTEQGLVGALIAILAGRVAERDFGEATELRGELVQLTLTPYMGAAEAAKAVAR